MSANHTFRCAAGFSTAWAVAAVGLLCGSAWGLVESTGPRGANARCLHDRGITGSGIRIAMLSSGNVRATHEAFALPDGQSAVTNHDFSGKGFALSAHDTQVAAICIARGGTPCPDCRGTAPGARLHSARISDGAISASTIERALRELIVHHECRIVVTGIQLPSASARPDGSSIWAKLYDYYAEHYDVFFANAAGNSDSAVTVFGDAFNGITTGGLALDSDGDWRITGSISNPGPTRDGRRKPELMAPAQRQMLPGAANDTAWAAVGSSRGETSYAAPHTAGVAALLMQRAAQTETPDADKTLTLKAILINTADPNLLGKANRLTHPEENVWHPHRGYGRIDARQAIDLLDAGRVRPDTTIARPAGWAYETLDDRQRHTYRIPAQKGQQLTVTLTWHRKLIRQAALAYIEEAPRLNLALEIKNPDGTTLFTEADPDNNLRKAALTLPQDGQYTLTIRNLTSQKNRHYAIALQRR